MEEVIKIPKARVGVLIGKKGRNKRNLERIGNVEIKVESSGKVTIKGDNSLKVFKASKVITAIGRGFKPKEAIKLFNDEYTLEVVRVSKQISKHKNQLERVRGRVIGTKGKFKREIEELCNVSIVVYGKTVSIIGTYENVELARNAIEMIIYGAKHRTVENVIARKRRLF